MRSNCYAPPVRSGLVAPTDPAPDSDLTAKARIRNSALDLFAARGVDATSIRTIAADAGVTPGLVVHHYGTKERLREAVDDRVVRLVADALAAAPRGTSRRAVRSARDASVAAMLEANPQVVDYLRRVLLDPAGDAGGLLEKVADLTAQQIRELQQAQLASTGRPMAERVGEILMGQLGQLFLQPLVDRTFDHFGEVDKPRLSIRLEH